MIRKTDDFKKVLKGKDVYIYFDTLDMCERLYPILKSKGYNVVGLIKNQDLLDAYKDEVKHLPPTDVTTIRDIEEIPETVFGYPVIDINEYKGDGIVVVDTLEENRRKYVSTLINNNHYNFVMLHMQYVNMLVGSIARGVIRNFRDTNYMAYGYEETEAFHVVVANKSNPDDFKFRLSGDWWFTQFMEYNKVNLKSDDLQKEYEDGWGKYSDLNGLDETEEAKKKFDEYCTFYSIRSHFDHIDPTNKIPAYLTPVQAGAALTEKKLCDNRDNTGDNISERNTDFSECSAIYWAWKNGEQNKKYIGVCHYRRFLSATAADLVEQFENDVDLINVIPTMMYPTIYKFFKRGFLYTKDFELMDEAIDKLFPDYRDAADYIRDGHWYLANNIFVMKKEWFDKMCEFVFGTILYIDEYYRKNGLVRGDRYAGYLFEYLYSVFIKKHALEMKIVYTNMSFLLKQNDMNGIYLHTKLSLIGLPEDKASVAPKKSALKRAYECVADHGISYSILYALRTAVKFVIHGFKNTEVSEEDEYVEDSMNFPY